MVAPLEVAKEEEEERSRDAERVFAEETACDDMFCGAAAVVRGRNRDYVRRRTAGRGYWYAVGLIEKENESEL